jgi:hypothetical protein
LFLFNFKNSLPLKIDLKKNDFLGLFKGKNHFILGLFKMKKSLETFYSNTLYDPHLWKEIYSFNDIPYLFTMVELEEVPPVVRKILSRFIPPEPEPYYNGRIGFIPPLIYYAYELMNPDEDDDDAFWKSMQDRFPEDMLNIQETIQLLKIENQVLGLSDDHTDEIYQDRMIPVLSFTYQEGRIMKKYHSILEQWGLFPYSFLSNTQRVCPLWERFAIGEYYAIPYALFIKIANEMNSDCTITKMEQLVPPIEELCSLD